MSYNVNGTNMLQWFYSASQPSNAPNTALTTNYRINGVDISNNYIGFATNSKIRVSTLYSLNYFSNGQNLGDLFELNLPNFYGKTINVDFKIWPPNGVSGLQSNNGLLIQFYKSMQFAFNYKVNCTFVAVGGGGGGGNSANNNAGGGGGGGGLLRGSIIGYDPAVEGPFNITIGNGGTAGNFGQNTVIFTNNYLIYANVGGNGGIGGGANGANDGDASGGTGFPNTGGGGGGAANASGIGGTGGSGTLFLYVTPDGVFLYTLEDLKWDKFMKYYNQ